MALKRLGLTIFLISSLGLFYTIFITHNLGGLIVGGFISFEGFLLFMYGRWLEKAEDNHRLNWFAKWFITH